MILRAQQRPKLPIERNEPFVSVPKTTPAVFDLDPRGERQGESDGEDEAAASLAGAGRAASGHVAATPLAHTKQRLIRRCCE